MRLIIFLVIFVANKFGAGVPLSKNGPFIQLSESGSGTVKGGMIQFGLGRMIGGNYVSITSVPWTCSLQRLGAHRCGCVIISPTVTLTTAHCANHIPGNGFYIRAGSDAKNRDGQLVPTRDIVIHPSHNEANLEHNICVVFLALPLNTDVPGVSTISLATSSLPTGALAIASGWGPLLENGPNSELLRSVTHPVYALSECGQRHGDRITHDMMCAGFYAGGAAACDPGSPLASNGVVFGIMSWSIGCGRPLLPSVYSRIDSARFWIEFVINSHGLQLD